MHKSAEGVASTISRRSSAHPPRVDAHNFQCPRVSKRAPAGVREDSVGSQLVRAGSLGTLCIRCAARCAPCVEYGESRRAVCKRRARLAHASMILVRLRGISWRNFRRLQDGSIEVRRHLVLIGPNDSGKSSILRAVHLCLGMAQPQLANSITPRDFSDRDKALRLEVELGDLSQDDLAAFPDEVDVTGEPVLRIAVESELDPDLQETMVVRRYFPNAGHGRAPSRTQLQTIRWAYVPATRSLNYELGAAERGAARSLLRGIDLGSDASRLAQAMLDYESELENAGSLHDFLTNLAGSLSETLPREVAVDDLHLLTAPVAEDSPLAGVTISIRDAGQFAPIAEQSDGIRAQTLLTILSLNHEVASIVAIDEPELHLQSSAQRNIGRLLSESDSQQVLATHSAAIVSQFSPTQVVAVSSARCVRQLPEGHRFSESEPVARHWAHRLIDPLTSNKLIFVEGPADRILVASIANLHGIDLDRNGIHVFELESADFLETARELFGPGGLGIDHLGLVDIDHEESWAEVLDLNPSEMADAGFYVAAPDLEGMYVDALGVERTIDLLMQSGRFDETGFLVSCGVRAISDLTEAMVADFCRSKKRKVRASIAIAHGLVRTDLLGFGVVNALLNHASRES